MSTPKSLSGFLTIDSERNYLEKNNEPLPVEFLKSQPGDTYKIELNVVVNSVEISSNNAENYKVHFEFQELVKIL